MTKQLYPDLYGLWAAGYGISYEHTVKMFSQTEKVRTYIRLGDAEGIRECIQEYCRENGFNHVAKELDDPAERLMWHQIVRCAGIQASTKK